jgi:hypothetical protein
MALRERDLPMLYQAADANSLEAQRRFLKVTSTELIMIVIAAAAGVVTWKTDSADWAGVIAAAAFAVALVLRIYLLSNRPDRTWYDGRAVAESAKNLAWRYAVGGEPFRIDTNEAEADELLVKRLRELLEGLKGVHLVPPSNEAEQITSGMRELRTKSLDERKQAYVLGRIDDQQGWYSQKARWNNKRANLWSGILTLIEAVGIVAAVFKAIGVLEVDLLGLAAAVAAAGMSWLQAKQYSNLAEAYSVAAQELAAVKARISRQSTEEEWARFVNEAEDAISREHTLWKASRTQ